MARWACIPFSLVGGWICGRWATRLYGLPSGILAMTLWFFSPMVIGHASLITPDAHAAALAVCAMYWIWNWLNSARWKNAVVAGLVLGLAELTKFTLLTVYPVILSLWAMYRLRSPARMREEPDKTHPPNERPAFHQLIVLLALSVLAINLGYGFEDTLKSLGNYRFQSRLFTGLEENQIVSIRDGQGNRFASRVFDSLPIPLPPNYVQGIDTQRYDFERGLSSYLRGEWADHGWWYYYLYALAIKEPLGTWCLLALAMGVTICQRGYSASRSDEMVVLVPGLAILILVSSQTGFSVHSRYIIPVLPFLFVWTSKVGRVFEVRSFSRGRLAMAVLVAIALTWSVGSSLWAYPHSLSYFWAFAYSPALSENMRPWAA